VVGEQSAPPTDAEFAFELPDKFMKKDVLANRRDDHHPHERFNGDAVINVIDQPPPVAGNVVMFSSTPAAGPRGTGDVRAEGGGPGVAARENKQDLRA
jgi:hypothetical protein